VTADLGVDRQRLTGLIDRIRGNPEAGRVVLRAAAAWQDGFRSEATVRHRDRTHTVTMDEPSSMGGSDAGPNMVEVVLGAYASCLISGFVAHAALTGIRLEGVEVDVEGDLDLQGFLGLRDPEEVWPGCTEVRATVRLSAADATEEELHALRDRVVRTSPVGSMIARTVTVRNEFA
jgi:uncharacterized OsmC-like protein